MSNIETQDDDRSITWQATTGRDAGKTFRTIEMPPQETVTFVLRLLSALRLGGVDSLLALMQPDEEEGSDIKKVLTMLAGCDAQAVRSLIDDALIHVRIAPDPQHPGMFRPLNVADIKEVATLGAVLGAFARTNIMPQG